MRCNDSFFQSLFKAFSAQRSVCWSLQNTASREVKNSGLKAADM